MALLVHRPGLLTTIQDEGRWGWQSFGVPVSGPMDWLAHRLANRLVGNPRSAALLEITLLGPELEFEGDAVVAVTGAEFDVTLDGRPLMPRTVAEVPAGSLLRFGERRRGARAYLAIAGGIDVPAVLGSRATHLGSRLGGLDGRALARGDRLRLGEANGRAEALGRRPAIAPPGIPDGGARARVIAGPHERTFGPGALEALQSARFVLTPDSNRMGYRLAGPPLPGAPRGTSISEPVSMGALQIPPSGLPILLMADRQTAGGYAVLATIATADLPLVGQLAPGDWIEFEPCSRRTAVTALQERLRIVGGPP